VFSARSVDEVANMLIRTRHWHRRVLGLISGSLLGGVLASDASAQLPPQAPPQAPPPAIAAPQAMLPPLMFVRVAGPVGMKATFFRGAEQGQTVDAPALVGLRPGYTYRIALSNVPGHPGRAFFPTLEVRASLLMNNRLHHADFPATLEFTEEDFARAEVGALLRKVIVLEHQERAEPLPTKAEEPLVIRVPRSRDPIAEALERGQPLVLMQMGPLELTREELAFTGIGGTVLLPGEKVLPPPRYFPTGPWTCFRVIDPNAEPVDPRPYICIPDGGDSGLPVGFGPDGKLRGVDPSDTVAEYVDSKGRRRLVVSNRVCLCIPRFIITRGEIQPIIEIATFAPGRATRTNSPDIVNAQQIVIAQSQRFGLEAIGERVRPSGTMNEYGTSVAGRIRGTRVESSLKTVQTVNGACLRPEEPAADLPLHIIKWPDKAGAMIGDIVTFTLRFTNRGGQPITDVVVVDSLAPRFEYVRGTSKTDREAAFTIQPNEAGSSILRWQFSGTLQPHESGTVTFQVRVR
jgi:uncharacterized repeat protein (TIGR01451 family)